MRDPRHNPLRDPVSKSCILYPPVLQVHNSCYWLHLCGSCWLHGIPASAWNLFLLILYKLHINVNCMWIDYKNKKMRSHENVRKGHVDLINAVYAQYVGICSLLMQRDRLWMYISLSEHQKLIQMMLSVVLKIVSTLFKRCVLHQILQMHEIFLCFCFYPEGRYSYSRGQWRVENNTAFIIGLLFVSLPCSRNHKRECECVGVCIYECGALSSLEWEASVSECVLSGKIDFASHSHRKNKNKTSIVFPLTVTFLFSCKQISHSAKEKRWWMNDDDEYIR